MEKGLRQGRRRKCNWRSIRRILYERSLPVLSAASELYERADTSCTPPPTQSHVQVHTCARKHVCTFDPLAFVIRVTRVSLRLSTMRRLFARKRVSFVRFLVHYHSTHS